ncbi:SEL1-like repeat protein [Chitinophaga tropicalis]|uniref:TPR repeat protein n=1 Tax=Chitinophaga tropicalis TaxID=2683588 RepID=A0A7K1UCR8_9BACT|nr:SEL1-like repeat protein [Chitinophaga tropicalis]MVT12068.1 hypothetical protein [Chitinophaga tropicalis]
MSHRMYLYNLDGLPGITERQKTNGIESLLATYGTGGEDSCLMMEWGYELPLLLQPLFSGETFIHTPVYNGTEGGLYTPAEQGIKALRALYDFIEKHHKVLVDDLTAFQRAKTKLYTFLENQAIHPLFHLDAWDVFNISDDGTEGNHTDQAKELIEEIRNNNAVISAAILADNPSMLDSCPEFKQRGSSFRSFRELLNYDGYGYGWKIISSVLADGDSDFTTYKQDSLYGLKDISGAVITPPVYKKIYPFPYTSDLAIVIKEGKYGFINREGEEVIPCIFDEAWDFTYAWAEVKHNGHFGIIDTTGEFILPAVYEDGYALTETYIAVKQNGLLQIIDLEGNVQIELPDAVEVAGIPDSGFPYFIATGKDGSNTYYSHLFRKLLSGPVENVDIYKEYYIISQQGKYGLLDANGEIQVPLSYKGIRIEYQLDGLIVESTDGKGFYTPGKGWLLPCEYQDIFILKDSTEDGGSMYAVVKKQHKKTGLFDTGKNPRWILPANYEGLKWIKPGYLAYKQGRYWGLMNNTGEFITEPLYESINGKYGQLTHGVALCFRKPEILAISSDNKTRPLTPEEAAKELALINSYLYSRTEVALLEELASPLQKAEEYFLDGKDAVDARQYNKAIDLFHKAIDLGHIEAMTDLGFVYEVEEGFIDYEQAFEWYTKAAEKGEMYAMNNLGLAYLHGRGTVADTDKAVYWFEKAVEKEHKDAYVVLGEIYYREEYERVDHTKALEYYWKAYEAGKDVADAMGNIYEIKQDYPNAVFYYNESVKKGSAYAKWRMGCFYTDGTGVPVNLHKAMELYQQAVTEYETVHVDLAILYMSATFYDYHKAKYHIDAATKAGVSYAEEYRHKLGL